MSEAYIVNVSMYSTKSITEEKNKRWNVVNLNQNTESTKYSTWNLQYIITCILL